MSVRPGGRRAIASLVGGQRSRGRTGRWHGAILGVVLTALTVAAGPPAPSPPAEDEFRVFEADLGRAWIDVSAYPPEQQKAYALFSQRCSKCHTLARPINSAMKGDEWTGYVNRMSRKPGAGISPKEVETILGFLIYDSNRRARTGALDPELVPLLQVSRELCGVRRFPASKRDVRAEEDGSLRVAARWDPRFDVSRLFPSDGGQKLLKWTQREPFRGELVARIAPGAGAAPSAPRTPAASGGLQRAVSDALDPDDPPEEKVEGILDWLDENLKKEFRAGTGTPDAILVARAGDATEFTTLFVAMARASGLACRSRVGLVARRTGFFGHAWAEVWLGRWVAVDPYFGQMPADVTHLRMATVGEDGLATWKPVPGLDRLELRVVLPPEPAAAPGPGRGGSGS